MRKPPAVPEAARVLLQEQDGALTTAQAMAAGLSRRQIRTLIESGWGHPFRGVLVAPHVSDPFRTTVRAALLACPYAVVHGITGARLHELWGLPVWTPSEPTELILPRGRSFNTRHGLRLHTGLREEEEWTVVDGFPVSDLERTVCQLAMSLSLDNLVCAVDSARRLGWQPFDASQHPRRRLHKAIALSDPRSESALETLGRLLLVRARLAPEVLQYEVRDKSGTSVRFDMAWPSVRLLVEFDGRKYHEDWDAFHRDRVKANSSAAVGWHLLRFTWFHVTQRPEYVVELVRDFLTRS